MKLYFLRLPLLLLSLILTALPAQAVRYAGDPADVPKLETLLNVLRVQQQELERLMSMLAQLEDWKKRLDKENARLQEEGELAKQDRSRFEDGALTEQALNEKWLNSGRSMRHDRDLKSFQKDVKEFNAYVKEYNLLTRKMSHVLDERSPPQVKSLISEMGKLISNIGRAINDGNIEKALFIARQSAIAAEFGYSEQ